MGKGGWEKEDGKRRGKGREGGRDSKGGGRKKGVKGEGIRALKD